MRYWAKIKTPKDYGYIESDDRLVVAGTMEEWFLEHSIDAKGDKVVNIVDRSQKNVTRWEKGNVNIKCNWNVQEV